MLDVSSRHIAHGTAGWLAYYEPSRGSDIILQPWFDSGWIIRVPDADEAVVSTLALQDHRGLAAVLFHARKLGCDYVKLDQDGEVIDGLETYNW